MTAVHLRASRRLQGLTTPPARVGTLAARVTVTVNGDVDPENSETFFVDITNVTGATVAHRSALEIDPGHVAALAVRGEVLSALNRDEEALDEVCRLKADAIVVDKVSWELYQRVKPGNAEELMAEPDIDGALVGGASLDADEFAMIVKGSARRAR